MAKVRPMYPPLAKWSAATGRKVLLRLDFYTTQAFRNLLEDVVNTGSSFPLDSAANIGRRAARALALEMLKARPHIYFIEPGETYRVALPESQALSVLAWMVSSPATDDATHDLRPLLDALHQLLS